MVAIQPAKGGFDKRWINYCTENSIQYRIVDCYDSSIIKNLEGCEALMWQFFQGNCKDILFAKQLLYSLENAGIKVFPDFHTMWHFDDKVGQKYLLEAIGAPLVPSYVFYDKKEAINWAEKATFPKVFKLRHGAGSANVKQVRSEKDALKLIKRAFGRGFSQYDPGSGFKERLRRYKQGTGTLLELIKGILRFIYPSEYVRVAGRDKGYIYFQDFIPGNDHDIRVIVIGENAFAIKRMVREGDFRASGSGNIFYERGLFDERAIKLSFQLTDKLNSQCVAFDYINHNGRPLVVEISYGFSPEGYDKCPGYWDKNLVWHEGKFNPYGWMVDSVRYMY